MKLSREDWLVRGLALLTRLGPDHLKVDRLCTHLKVTKGSFYHHFNNREQYVDALLEYWQARNTRGIIEAVSHIDELRQRSMTLGELARGADTGPENAIRAWARYDDRVTQRLEQVDRQRVDFLSQLIAPQLADPARAPLIAKLVYAHFVGVQQLRSLIDTDEWRAMDELLHLTLTRTALMI